MISNVVFPIRNSKGKVIKCGRIDGVPFKTVAKQCERFANKYVDDKYPELLEVVV